MTTIALHLAQTTAPAAAAATEVADASWIGIGLGLLLLALVLFAVELFIPSGGMLGILCGLAAIASVISFFFYSPAMGGFALLVYLIATPFLLVYGVKLWSRTPIGRRLILGGTEELDGRGLDEDEIDQEIDARRRQTHESDASLLGRIARTVTPLRPVGVIRLDGRRLDALAESGVIDVDIDVEVIAVLDNQIKVRTLRTPAPSSADDSGSTP
jgi:membrane-bound ClpP family serine protease